jgi:hypothetical protein
MTSPGLKQDNKNLCSSCQICQMTKKVRKKYGLFPHKISESDTFSLGHGLCGCSEPIYNKDTGPNIHHSLLALTMIDPEIYYCLV